MFSDNRRYLALERRLQTRRDPLTLQSHGILPRKLYPITDRFLGWKTWVHSLWRITLVKLTEN